MTVFVLVAVAVMTVVTPVGVTTAGAEPPICSPSGQPSLPGDDGCIPSPLDCLTGQFDGLWQVRDQNGVPVLQAECTTDVDPETGKRRIVDYRGGSVTGVVPCGAGISYNQMQAGFWTDPNRCPPASAPPGYGVKGRAYQPPVLIAGGVVSSVSPEAAAVGTAVLNEGGNAIDAAVATTFAVGVTRPEMCGIGGGGFLVYRSAKGETTALDFRETAPADFRNTTVNEGGRFGQFYGHLRVGVPGTVAGMAAALERYGTIPLARAIAPAQRLAKDGVAIGTDFSDVSNLGEPVRNFDKLRRFEASRKIYLDESGRPWRPTPISPPLKQTDYAASLDLIAKYGPEAFYTDRQYPADLQYPEGRPSIGRLIAKEMERSRKDYSNTGDRGLMTAADLANYRAVWRTPLKGTYRGAQIIAMPPPTSGGVVTLEVLNLIEGYLLGRSGAAWAHSSANHLHLLTEAVKIAWADRNTWLGDPDFVQVPTNHLTSKEYADKRRGEIDLGRAKSYEPGTVPGFTPGGPTSAESTGGHTTHVSVIDDAGNAASVTCTIGQAFGSAVVAPGTGFLLNSQIDFSAPGTANEGGPGKRSLSSNSPTIVVRNDKPILVVGAAGGRFIPMSVVNTIVNVLDFGMDLAHAVDAARVDRNTDFRTARLDPDAAEACCGMRLEHLRVLPEVQDELSSRGHWVAGTGEYGRTHIGSTMAIVQAAGTVLEPVGNSSKGRVRRVAVSDHRY